MNTTKTPTRFFIQYELMPEMWVNYWDNGYPLHVHDLPAANDLLMRYQRNQPEARFRIHAE